MTKNIEDKKVYTTYGRDSYENRIALNQIDNSRSIFIRGGESRFITYCVKTPSAQKKMQTHLIHTRLQPGEGDREIGT